MRYLAQQAVALISVSINQKVSTPAPPWAREKLSIQGNYEDQNSGCKSRILNSPFSPMRIST
jgi:hypothetical protein